MLKNKNEKLLTIFKTKNLDIIYDEIVKYDDIISYKKNEYRVYLTIKERVSVSRKLRKKGYGILVLNQKLFEIV